jgi:propionyl-CoA carboxylase beta chain
LVQEYREELSTPYHAASQGYVDDVIEPRETRPKIVAALASQRDKHTSLPPRKHGNIPV